MQNRFGIFIAIILIILMMFVAWKVAVVDQRTPPDFPVEETQALKAIAASNPRLGTFRVFCLLSHRLPDDPIIFPGQPGASHSHDFMGSTVVNASSTTAELLAGDTSCKDRKDKSGYWIPTLLYKDKAIPALGSTQQFTFYYHVYPDTVPPPNGLKIVSNGRLKGNNWDCVNRDAERRETFTKMQAEIPFCPKSPYGSALRLVIDFPDCWDGKNLDSEDHRSHMAFSANGFCPSTHPVHIPWMNFSFRYPAGMEAEYLKLSSGSGTTSHADVIFAWDEPAVKALVSDLKE